jgi:pimeloyl-ACP methyl ester carboxylesterase
MTAIVFVHGTRLTGSMWTPQLAGLGEEFETIAIDLPGHGVRSHERFSLARAVEVVAEAIDDTATRRAVVVGLSLGGYVAMALAAAAPAHVQGLVVAGATAEPVGWRAVPVRALAGSMDLAAGSRLEALQARFFRRRYAPALADPIIAGGFWTAAGATALRAIAGESFKPRLAAYPGPCLIVNGEFDFVFRPGSRAFASAARDGRRVRIAGASHLANLDRPAAFNEAVRRFARSMS